MGRKSVQSSVPARRQKGAPFDGFVRAGPLTGLPALLRDLGCDPDPIFASTGLDPARFLDPDVEIPFVPVSRLLARCVAATGCEHLGLLLGERVTPESLGVAGFMLQTAPDVGTALRDLVHHLDLHDRGGVATLVTNDRSTCLGYAIHLSGVEATNQINDLAMTVACKVMRELCGAEWNPTAVLLSRRAPQDLVPYRRFFRAPLHFNAERNALGFPTHELDQSVARADPVLHRHLEQEAHALHADQQMHLVGEVRKLLRRSLAVRNGGVTVIAEQLGMHERTLNRRLRAEGTTFRRELEDTRYEVARHLLAETTVPLSRIAAALDYSDSTAFIRAFKRWSGFSPAEWRRIHRRS
ncbi:MAG: AraC family transcriptional regulator [Pseudomonadota bacterium]|nr:AraC family transcriptional regulator [Pseudomonadota bacterium]